MFGQKEKTTEQLIEERIKELPEVIRDVILNSEWRETLQKIISDNNLLLDQGLAIKTETLLIMLGLDDHKDYTKNIKKVARLSNDQAIKIATEVNNKVLKIMKDKIIKESYRESGRAENEIDDLLGYREELEKELPSIDLSSPEPEGEGDRDQLINDLGDDIKIEDNPDDGSSDMLSLPENEEQKEGNQNKDEEETYNYTPREPLDPSLELKAAPQSNKIELGDNEMRASNTIETETKKEVEYEPMKEKGQLPNLDPLRTLERDTDDLRGRPHRKTETLEKLRDGDVLIKEADKEGEKPKTADETKKETEEEPQKDFVPENIPTESTPELNEPAPTEPEEDDIAIRPRRLETSEEMGVMNEEAEEEVGAPTTPPEPKPQPEPKPFQQQTQQLEAPQSPQESGGDPYREPIE